MTRPEQKLSGLVVVLVAKTHTDFIPPADRAGLNRSLIQVQSTGIPGYATVRGHSKVNREAYRKRAGVRCRKKRMPSCNEADRN